jgi:hypothetical protein
MLLAILIVTGYRNVLRALRRDPSQGAIRLAFFLTALVYSLTGAGFRMMTPVWIAFLLAITAVPEAVIPEGSLVLGAKRAWSFAEAEPQLERVFNFGFCEGTS